MVSILVAKIHDELILFNGIIGKKPKTTVLLGKFLKDLNWEAFLETDLFRTFTKQIRRRIPKKKGTKLKINIRRYQFVINLQIDIV